MYLHIKYPCGYEVKLFSIFVGYQYEHEGGCPIYGKDCKKVE